jgi:hypothetical protein
MKLMSIISTFVFASIPTAVFTDDSLIAGTTDWLEYRFQQTFGYASCGNQITTQKLAHFNANVIDYHYIYYFIKSGNIPVLIDTNVKQSIINNTNLVVF